MKHTCPHCGNKVAASHFSCASGAKGGNKLSNITQQLGYCEDVIKRGPSKAARERKE